jgi:Uma2 family endonuclease
MANLTMTTSPRIPLLCAGDVLTRDEFERRYQAMPWLKKAELIEGVVYMGSPVRIRHHGIPEQDMAAWLAFYRRLTPGLSAAGNTTVRLDLDNEPQPDLLLRVPASAGGNSRLDADDYVSGPPELVIEIAASSASYDLHQKLRAYRRNGVREYLVVRFDDRAIDWFVLTNGIYVRREPDAEGRLHSEQFPGLSLDVAAYWRGDLSALERTLRMSTATPEHGAFVLRLATAPPE